MTTTTASRLRDLEGVFNRYYEKRLQEAGAITPGQKLAVLDELERELREEGKVPTLRGLVTLPLTNPMVRAALEGREVVLGGKTVTTPPQRGALAKLQAQPVGVRLLMLSLIPLFFLVACGVYFWVRGSNAAVAAAPPTPTVTVTAGPVTPSPTLLPEPTATPYALALTTGDAAPRANDPASIEIAGFSYVLGVGEVENGEWTPQAAEWLADTQLHRVIAVPWEADLANAVSGLRPGNLLTVRLRSGDLAKYKISQVARVQRQQIELLTGRTPGISVVLYGEPSDQRTVIVGVALQEAGDITGYTDVAPLPQETPADLPPTSDSTSSGTVATPLPEPTEVTTVQTVLVTDTLSVTHPTAGIALTVLACDRMREVQGQPAPSKEEYLVCEVEVRNTGSQMARFTDQAFGITEKAWWETRPDWMPTVNVSVTDALGAGTFAPGDRAQGRLVGLVARPTGGLNGKRSEGLLIWFQDGVRYVISLPSE